MEICKHVMIGNVYHINLNNNRILPWWIDLINWFILIILVKLNTLICIWRLLILDLNTPRGLCLQSWILIIWYMIGYFCAIKACSHVGPLSGLGRLRFQRRRRMAHFLLAVKRLLGLHLEVLRVHWLKQGALGIGLNILQNINI